MGIKISKLNHHFINFNEVTEDTQKPRVNRESSNRTPSWTSYWIQNALEPPHQIKKPKSRSTDLRWDIKIHQYPQNSIGNSQPFKNNQIQTLLNLLERGDCHESSQQTLETHRQIQTLLNLLEWGDCHESSHQTLETHRQHYERRINQSIPNRWIKTGNAIQKIEIYKEIQPSSIVRSKILTWQEKSPSPRIQTLKSHTDNKRNPSK